MRRDVVDRHDVGVVEPRRRFGLGVEPRHVLRQRPRPLQEPLQRHDPAQPGLPGPVDHPHPSPAQLLEQLAIAEGRAVAGLGGDLARPRGPRPGRSVAGQPGHLLGDAGGGPEVAELAGQLGVVARDPVHVGGPPPPQLVGQLLEHRGEQGFDLDRGLPIAHGPAFSEGVSPSRARSRRRARRCRIPAAASLRPSARAASAFESCSK